MKSIYFRTMALVAGIALMATLVGCDDPKLRHSQNAANIDSPTVIKTMKDGRTLYCIEYCNDDDFQHTHFIYFFGMTDTNTVTINSTVHEGKFSYNQVIVIDGKTYTLTPKD